MKSLFILASVLTLFSSYSQNPWFLQNANIPTTANYVHSSMRVVNSNVVWSTFDDKTSGQNLLFTRTIDGQNWQIGFVPTNTITGQTFSSIAAINKDTAYTTVNYVSSVTPKIFKTIDGGANWLIIGGNTYTSSSSYINAIHFFDESNGVVCGDPENGYFEIYTSQDGGNSFNRVPQVNIPAILSGEYGISDVFGTTGNYIWFGTTKGRVFKSKNKGLSWTVSQVFTSNQSVGAIAMKDTLNAIIAGYSNNMKRTSNGGNTFTTITTSGPWGITNGNSFVYAKQNGLTPAMFVCAKESNKFASFSIDDGVTWNILDTMYHKVFGFYNSNIGYTGASQTNSITINDIFKLQVNITSIKKINSENLFDIYPNPCYNSITIAAKHNCKIIITDLLGQVILSSQIHFGNNSIDFSDQKNGIYFIKTENQTFKIIKQ